MTEIKKLIGKLSPNERKILPFVEASLEEIEEKTNLEKIAILRSLDFLENKGLIKQQKNVTQIIHLGTNGLHYKKTHLPERKLINLLSNSKPLSLIEAQKEAHLSENEFRVSLGILKRKNMIKFVNGNITFSGTKEEISKKIPEEILIDSLPKKVTILTKEEKDILEELKNRKEILEFKEEKEIIVRLTDIGKEVLKENLNVDLIEELTPEIIKNWSSNKKFRTYDLTTPLPALKSGKKHFVTQSIEQAKRIWLDMGFKEMNGNLTETSFWVFDALFTPQDHPAREMQDTFFIKNVSGKLPAQDITEKVKRAQRGEFNQIKSEKLNWDENEAKKVVLRTHTTSVSARTISKIKKESLPLKYFTIGKVFRNETLDWSHLFEFYQTEGIVIDKNANLRNLFGYLTEFYKKMGYEKIKFVPSFFAYTEPSVEIQVFNKEKNKWIELGGAGILRPEVVIPLLGEYIPILAWGQGFERIIMNSYKIKDLREVYENNIKELRNKPYWRIGWP